MSQLRPWFENLAKRQVKRPKVYVRDSGLLHALFNVATLQAVLAHPKAGASWEGFLLEEVLKAARPDQAYFWATHQGAELDLLMLKSSRRVGVEFDRADARADTIDAHCNVRPQARCTVRYLSRIQAVYDC